MVVGRRAGGAGRARVGQGGRDATGGASFGTGGLIWRGLSAGVESIVLGIGGSGTNDGGSGMARALGYRFLDRDGRELPEGGAPLRRRPQLEGQTDPWLIRPSIEVGSDLTNPLTGAQRA